MESKIATSLNSFIRKFQKSEVADDNMSTFAKGKASIDLEVFKSEVEVTREAAYKPYVELTSGGRSRYYHSYFCGDRYIEIFARYDF